MMTMQDAISNYPFLSSEEFSLACHLLDQKYIAAILGQERQKFRFRLQHSMLDDSISISITKPIDLSKNDVSLVLDLKALNWAEEDVATSTLMDVDAEYADTDALHPNSDEATSKVIQSGQDDELPGYSKHAQQPYVVYEIHLHPTYRTPVLWFSLHDLPPCDSPLDIDVVYRYLVPDQYKDHLRSIGVMGGISAANHPLTDLPAFFIHPCGTKEAMEQFNCSLKEYLSIWLGLVGGYVELWLPAAMVLDDTAIASKYHTVLR